MTAAEGPLCSLSPHGTPPARTRVGGRASPPPGPLSRRAARRGPGALWGPFKAGHLEEAVGTASALPATRGLSLGHQAETSTCTNSGQANQMTPAVATRREATRSSPQRQKR